MVELQFPHFSSLLKTGELQLLHLSNWSTLEQDLTSLPSDKSLPLAPVFSPFTPVTSDAKCCPG